MQLLGDHVSEVRMRSLLLYRAGSIYVCRIHEQKADGPSKYSSALIILVNDQSIMVALLNFCGPHGPTHGPSFVESIFIELMRPSNQSIAHVFMETSPSRKQEESLSIQTRRLWSNQRRAQAQGEHAKCQISARSNQTLLSLSYRSTPPTSRIFSTEWPPEIDMKCLRAYPAAPWPCLEVAYSPHVFSGHSLPGETTFCGSVSTSFPDTLSNV